MPRAKGGYKTRRRRNRVIKRASGYWGARHHLYAVAKETVDRALAYAFAGRKQRKRQFRSLWITRLNAALRTLGLRYSTFVHDLAAANVQLDRRILAEIAYADAETFEQIAREVQTKQQAA